MAEDLRMELVDRAIARLQSEQDAAGVLSDREALAFDALRELRCVLHDVASAGAQASQQAMVLARENHEMAGMLRDFAEWSRQAQRLMAEAADELWLRRFGHVRDERDAVRIVGKLRRAIEQVKDPADLDPEGEAALADTSRGPLSGLVLLPGGANSDEDES